MKKFWSLFALIMLTVSAVTIVSCSKDDDDSDDPLEGVWYGSYSRIQGSSYTYRNVLIEAEDGEGVITYFYYGDRDAQYNFTYTYNDEEITITTEDDEKVVYEYDLKEKKGVTTLVLERRKGGVEEVFELEKEEEDDDYYDYDDYSYRY